jgi:hypothetical protein
MPVLNSRIAARTIEALDLQHARLRTALTAAKERPYRPLRFFGGTGQSLVVPVSVARGVAVGAAQVERVPVVPALQNWSIAASSTLSASNCFFPAITRTSFPSQAVAARPILS